MRRPLVLFGKLIIGLLSVASSVLLACSGWLVWHAEQGIGVPTEREIADLPATGHVCNGQNQSAYVPLTEMPPLVRNAALASDDPDFYERPHLGPLWEIAHAFTTDQRSPNHSNIVWGVTRLCVHTMQPTCCKGIDWHIGSLVFMERVTKTLSRDRMLEIYLNDSYLGRGADGVAAGAEAYYGKTLEQLEVDEIAFLLTRIRSPVGRVRDYDKERRDHVIDWMAAAGVISDTEAVAAKGRPLTVRENPTGTAVKSDNQ